MQLGVDVRGQPINTYHMAARINISMTDADLRVAPASIEDLTQMLAGAQHIASLYAHRDPTDRFLMAAIAHVNDLTAQISETRAVRA